MKSQDENATKKSYESPKLVVYGDIRDITQANDMAGMADGGMGNDKT